MTTSDVNLAPAVQAQAQAVTRSMEAPLSIKIVLTVFACTMVLGMCVPVTVAMINLAAKKTHIVGTIMGAAVCGGISIGTIGVTAVALRDLNRLKQKETPPDVSSRKTAKVSIPDTLLNINKHNQG